MTEIHKPLILIVDDVAQNLRLLGNILRENNYRVAAATSGQQALGILAATQGQPPDLILLDIMMPGMDGFQVAKILKEQDHTSGIPVIFLTARTQTEDIVQGFETGAVDYITKPFNKAELLARVKTHLALRRAQKEIAELEKKNGVLAMALTANHEINQPLTVLQGNFEIYSNSLDPQHIDEKQQRSLDKIRNAIQRIRNILEKFMNTPGIRFEEYLDEKEQVVFE